MVLEHVRSWGIAWADSSYAARSACQIFGIVAVLRASLSILNHPDFDLTGYVLDSSGYGLAAFRVAGALGPSSRFQQRDEGVPRRPGGPPHLGCCRGIHLGQAHTQEAVFYWAAAARAIAWVKHMPWKQYCIGLLPE